MFEKFAIFGLLFLSFGCTHFFERGTVILKLDANTAYVCLGENSVKNGEKVYFFKFECKESRTHDHTSSTRIGDTSTVSPAQTHRHRKCKRIRLGHGHVKSVVDNHYSLVKTTGRFEFDERTIVQTKE